ncbi:MAG: hypothetical protein II704_07305, partial [Erysipelotrichaceae bacterium]|nr:hypothetical protein [Erysipelotrichaceae bacterium]
EYFGWNYKNDGASLLASLLLEEASDIKFFMGCAVNPAHQNNSQLGITLKMKLLEELAAELKKANKNVEITYF